VDKWVGVLGKLASDPDWLAGNARIGGIPAIRSPVETENFVRDQYDFTNASRRVAKHSRMSWMSRQRSAQGR